MRWTAVPAATLVTAALGAAALVPDSALAAGPGSDPWTVTVEQPTTVSNLLTRLNQDARLAESSSATPVSSGAWTSPATRDRPSPWAASSRDVWFENGAFDDRLRLQTDGPVRRVDGSALPPSPLDPAAYEAVQYDLTYTRLWTETLVRTPSGLALTITPHVGVGVGSQGGSTEAGATLRVGQDIDRMLPEGEAAFGERPRWYLYAAGSGRAVGYNWARNRDGDFDHSGVSRDAGAFMGDASLGLAMRRGPIHSSFGLVYREIETEGMRAGYGLDTDVSEGLVAFQLSIKPE